jgi:Tfp pilus assembly protein PilF
MEAPINIKDFVVNEVTNKRKLAEFYNYKGVQQADEGNLIEALKYFNKALQIDPMYKEAMFNRATIKADLGEFEEAREDFCKISSMNIQARRENLIENFITKKTPNINFY